MMSAHSFRLISVWRVQGSIREVADILSEAEDFPRWWPEVYLGIEVLAPGDANGIGRRIAVHSRGWLPYHLHWTGELVSADLPATWRIRAEGDLAGEGVWTLRQIGAEAEVTYDWQVRADRPLFRRLAPLLKPVFAWNHRWAMAKGEAGLKRELRRRRSLGQPMRP
jgi:hypothetical protein